MNAKLFNFILLISMFLVNLLAFGEEIFEKKEVAPVQVKGAVKEGDNIKNRLEEIEKEKKLLENEMLQKQEALKSYKKECKLALEKQTNDKLEKVDKRLGTLEVKADKRLEIMEIKFEVNKLKKERDFLKKYERLGVRKTKINKLENMQKELNIEKEQALKKLTKEDSGEINSGEINKDLNKINKDLRKIKKELDNFEKISQKDYIQNRLVEIDQKLEALSQRSKELRENLSEPKKYKKDEIKTNLSKVEQELKFEQLSFQETIANLEQEELLLKKKSKQLFS